jgi:polyphosphate glucokinase
VNGVLEPMELAHLPYKHGKTFEHFVGERGLSRLGKTQWRKTVADVVARLTDALEPEYVVIGGGNARLLRSLPKNVRLGRNDNAFRGGFLLWEHPRGKRAEAGKES